MSEGKHSQPRLARQKGISMPVTKRAFLKFLSAAPIAGHALASQAAKLSGASMLREVSPMSGRSLRSPGPSNYPNETTGGWIEKLRGRALSLFLRTNGVPAWKLREIRNDARASRLIDPDLAALRSVSPGFMLRQQWARNEARGVHDMMEWMDTGDERQDYLTKNNLEWF